MMITTLQKVHIDPTIFIHAFGWSCHEFDSPTPYIHRATGEFTWIYEDDDVAAKQGISREKHTADRELVEGAPDLYLKVQRFDHNTHHAILQDFIELNWMDDDDGQREAKRLYKGSIARWMDAVEEDVREEFMDYQLDTIERMAEEFLLENGIDSGCE